jgi:hypothetical protein
VVPPWNGAAEGPPRFLPIPSPVEANRLDLTSRTPKDGHDTKDADKGPFFVPAVLVVLAVLGSKARAAENR